MPIALVIMSGAGYLKQNAEVQLPLIWLAVGKNKVHLTRMASMSSNSGSSATISSTKFS